MEQDNYPLALVTGAAHRLGLAFSLSLARSGYALLLHCYNSSPEQVGLAAGEVKSLGVPIYRFRADLANQTEIHSLFSYVDTLPNKLKVLINSAAVMKKPTLAKQL